MDSPKTLTSIEQIKLGVTYKDVITNFTGVAISWVEYMGGNTMVNIQPQCGEDEKKPESHFCDFQSLYELPDGKTVSIPPKPMSNSLAIGDEVRDKANGYQGIVTAKHIWINGCVHYRVEGMADGKKPGLIMDQFPWLDGDRLKLIKAVGDQGFLKSVGGDRKDLPQTKYVG